MKNARHMFMRQLMAVVLVVSLAAPGCAAGTAGAGQAKARQAGVIPPPDNTSFSREQEIQVGREAAAEAMKQLPVLPESHPISRYISRLGQRLAGQTPAPQWPYVFRVVAQKEINAFALPGGPVFINLGTITSASNESELAGVMGHEIAHVYMRHGTAQATKQGTLGGLAQLGSVLLGGVLGQGIGGQLAQLGLAVGAQGMALKYSREAEREADTVGAYVLHQSGIDPRGMVSFFEELSAQSGGKRGPQWMSSHPDPGNRARDVGDTIRELPRRSYERDHADFQAIKRQAQQARSYSAEEIAQQQKRGGFGNQGGVGGGSTTSGPGGTATGPGSGEIMPSGEFLTLNHQAYQISYPSNWEAFGDESSSVTVAPRAGIAENAIAYGVIINGWHPHDQRRMTLEQATSALLEELRQANPEMRASGNAQRIRVNNRQALSVDLSGRSPLQMSGGGAVRERDWLVTTQMSDGTLLYLVFVAPEPDFNKLRPTFENMLRSLRVR